MQIRATDNAEDFGRCGCGRSPTGKCIGWHGLSKEQYQIELNKYNKEQVDSYLADDTEGGSLD
jgi:hypothetical protein